MVGVILAGKSFAINTKVLVYVVLGNGKLNGIAVKDGDLVRDDKLEFVAISDTKLGIIYVE